MQELAAIEFRNVSKSYGNNLVLDSFTHQFEAARVHALMGKNGSGKSTLVKILGGVVQASAGEMLIDGHAIRPTTPQEAQVAGIITIYQELSLVSSLSVAENIAMGNLPVHKVCGIPLVHWPSIRQQATRMLQEMELDIDPDALVSKLSVGQQQMVEIVKAMSADPKILLLDEPTSALASKEVEHLFSLVRKLRSRGVTMVYITHRMNELFEIADTCTVLADGKLIGSIPMHQATPAHIVEMMFGQVAKVTRPARTINPERRQTVLKVSNLSRDPVFRNIGFELGQGEVLGIAGLLGSGRTELLRAIFGADSFDSGEIMFCGETLRKTDPRRMRDRGLGYTSENRKEDGLVQILSIHENLVLANLARIALRGFLTKGMEAPYVSKQVAQLDIKVVNTMLPVSSLSGGNQQKVVIGNWLNTGPKVMFFDEPSRGIDIQAKQHIFRTIWEQAERGLSTIFVSSELEEVLEVCDRILVMRAGQIVAERMADAISLTELYELCMRDQTHNTPTSYPFLSKAH